MNVSTGDVSILNNVNLGVAANVAATLCGISVPVAVLAVQVFGPTGGFMCDTADRAARGNAVAAREATYEGTRVGAAQPLTFRSRFSGGVPRFATRARPGALGYIAAPRIGAAVYDTAHFEALPIAFALVGPQ